jgi:hypothetical protein
MDRLRQRCYMNDVRLRGLRIYKTRVSGFCSFYYWDAVSLMQAVKDKIVLITGASSGIGEAPMSLRKLAHVWF